MSPRRGIVILTDLPWREAAPRWRAAEAYGFDHAWTYDHLVWGGLPDAPWRAAMPTLAAAAGVTSSIRLGPFVASPNFRHPYPFLREILALDDISGGRFLLGVGTGGDLDSVALGQDLTLKQRVDRFQEFTVLLSRMLSEDRVDHRGTWYAAREARTLPGVGSSRPGRPAAADFDRPVPRDSQPPVGVADHGRVPLLVAGNGPRSVRLAAEAADGWITYGGKGETLDAWFAQVGALMERFTEARAKAGNLRARTYLSLDSSPVYSLSSRAAYDELTGRAADLGFTDVVLHWPRPDSPYAGDEALLDDIAAHP